MLDVSAGNLFKEDTAISSSGSFSLSLSSPCLGADDISIGLLEQEGWRQRHSIIILKRVSLIILQRVWDKSLFKRGDEKTVQLGGCIRRLIFQSVFTPISLSVYPFYKVANT